LQHVKGDCTSSGKKRCLVGTKWPLGHAAFAPFFGWHCVQCMLQPLRFIVSTWPIHRMVPGKIGDARWLTSQQVGQGTLKALLAFWLTSLFASFGLFAPRNATSVLFVTLCAIAIAGAIMMILELEDSEH